MQEIYLPIGLIRLNIYYIYMEDENLTIEEISKNLKVSKQTVTNWLKEGRLPGFKLPGSRLWRINRNEFEKFMRDWRKSYEYK